MNNRRGESRRTIDRAIDSCFEHIIDGIIILDFDLKGLKPNYTCLHMFDVKAGVR